MSLLRSVAGLCEAISDVPTSAIRGLAEAKGIMYLKLSKIGCIVTIRGGHGLVLLKTPENKWSAPMGVQFGGFALGADIGLERSEFVILFKEQATCVAFMEGNATIGLNGSLTLGPLGYEGEVLTNTGAKEPITIIGKSVGLYGGVSLEFSGVKPDRRANMTQYERRIEVSDLAEGKLDQPVEFEKLYKILDKECEAALARLAEVQAKAAALQTEAKRAAAEAAMEEAQRKAAEAQQLMEEVTVAKAEEEDAQTAALTMKAKAARIEADAQKANAERSLNVARMKANRAEQAAQEASDALESQKSQEEQNEEAQKQAAEQELQKLQEEAALAAQKAQDLAQKAADAETLALQFAKKASMQVMQNNLDESSKSLAGKTSSSKAESFVDEAAV